MTAMKAMKTEKIAPMKAMKAKMVAPRKVGAPAFLNAVRLRKPLALQEIHKNQLVGFLRISVCYEFKFAMAFSFLVGFL